MPRNLVLLVLVAAILSSQIACGEDDITTIPVDTIPPTMASTAPTAGEADVPITAEISATFSENMDPDSFTATSFTLSGTTGTVTAVDETATFTPDANLASGTQYTATITTEVTDKAGNALETEQTWTFTTAALSVIATAPLDAATAVSANSTVAAILSEDIDAATITASSLVVAGVNGTLSVEGPILRFTPTNSLDPATEYTATISTDFQSQEGNSLASDFTWTFTTNALTVATTAPADEATGVPVTTTISATMSEVIDATTVTASAFSVGGVSGTVSIDGSTLTLTPNSNLSPGTLYTGTVTTTFRSVSGNRLVANESWSFTTGGQPVANAGVDRDYTIGEAVALNGSGSFDPDNATLSYAWTQRSGPSVTFNASLQQPTLSSLPTEVSTLEFDLVVSTINGSSTADRVVVAILEDKNNKYFVAAGGNDSNTGTRNAPFETIQNAVDIANAAGNGADVYVAEATYNEAVSLEPNVSIYGGFNASTWVRDTESVATTIDGGQLVATGRVAVFGSNANSLTLDGLTIRSPEAIEVEHSSIGVWLFQSSGVVISGCVIESGAGGPGAAGSAGTPGSTGNNGTTGTLGGVCDVACECSGGNCSSGGGGGSGSGRAGGRGGDSGNNFGCAGDGGTGAGGDGGTGGGLRGAGDDGDPGDPGSNGANGLGAGFFGFVGSSSFSGAYNPDDGSSGGGGTSGGGGGGGGGAGGNSFTCGGGGGGGGAGGTAGTGGTFGTGGGGSFGVYLVYGSSVNISETQITTANGGAGGAGGTGGTPGSGGLGRSGGNGVSDGGKGGRGGDGGDGGAGGHGGGGGGGPSIGIVEDNSSSSVRTGLNFTLGSGGAGGASNGNPGATGQRTTRKKL